MGTLLRQELARRVNPIRERAPRRLLGVTPRRLLSVFEAAPDRFFSVRKLKEMCKKRKWSRFVEWACGHLERRFKIVERHRFFSITEPRDREYRLLEPVISLRSVEHDILEYLSNGNRPHYIKLWSVCSPRTTDYGFSLRFEFRLFVDRLLEDGKLSVDFNEDWGCNYYVTGKQALEWEVRKAAPVV